MPRNPGVINIYEPCSSTNTLLEEMEANDIVVLYIAIYAFGHQFLDFRMSSNKILVNFDGKIHFLVRKHLITKHGDQESQCYLTGIQPLNHE